MIYNLGSKCPSGSISEGSQGHHSQSKAKGTEGYFCSNTGHFSISEPIREWLLCFPYDTREHGHFDRFWYDGWTMGKPIKELKPLLEEASELGCRIVVKNGRKRIIWIYPPFHHQIEPRLVHEGEGAVQKLRGWLNRLKKNWRFFLPTPHIPYSISLVS